MVIKITDRIGQLPSIDWDRLPLLLDEHPAAQALGVSVSYLRKSRSEGTRNGRTPPPPFIKLDGRRLYRTSDLRAWAEALESRIAI